MKTKKYIKLSLLGPLLFAFSATFLANYNIERHYQADEYVKSKNAYYVTKVDDAAGLVKAKKFTVPTDNKYETQKSRSLGTNLIGDIESVWDTYTGAGTTIAIIDDGFDYNHPEYLRSDGTSAILPTSRYYFTDGSMVYYHPSSYIGQDWESDDDGNYEWTSHGTATSTTAAAPMNNGGGVGIAPSANILALKVDFYFSSIQAAIRYAIEQKVDVINMSLGAYAENFTDGWGDKQDGDYTTATYLDSVCLQAYNAGIIVVAAAGNEATWHKSYPASNKHVIGVGALGDWNNKGNPYELAEFTNYVSPSQTGEVNVDILAPGYVYTARLNGTESNPLHTYTDTQGTSFSSPIVAGAAALWKEKYPSGTPSEFLNQLQDSADGKGYYTNKMIKVSGWDSSCRDVGPSNITNGRLNVANLLNIDNPYVTTKQTSLNISIGEKRQIDLTTSNGIISYHSNNINVATVSNSGLVEGVGAGTTSITLTATKNGVTAVATVDVSVAEILGADEMHFNPSSITLNIGETYNAEETIITTPASASRIFMFDSKDKNVATVDEDTGLVTAVGVGITEIEVISGYGDGYDVLTVRVKNALPQSGFLFFGSASGSLNVNSSSKKGIDNLNNSWLVTTTGTTSFTTNAGYSQIGSANNAASTIEFKMTLATPVTFTNVSASFGGFNGSKATVTIKVGSTQIGLGNVYASTDTITTNSSTASGTILTISLTNIAKGIKAYSITYSYISSEGGDPATPPTLESVSVSNPKTYHPGETIVKNDINVNLNYSDGSTSVATNFIFSNDGYRFTYEDTLSGDASTSKEFSITYEEQTYNFSVNVVRLAYQATLGTSTALSSPHFNSSDLSKNINTPSSPSVTIGGVPFTVTTNAYVFSSENYYISFGKGIGSINNTNAFSVDLMSVSVTQKSGARQDGVLTISKDGKSWITYSANEIANGGYRYFKYAYTSASSTSGAAGYSNLQSISYTLAGPDSVTSIANYIMYEDTNNQCVSKLPLTVGKLNTMSNSDKNTFWTSEDYVITIARQRLIAWASHEGYDLSFTNSSFLLNARNHVHSLFEINKIPNYGTLLVIVFFGAITTGGYFFIQRKKKN